MNLNLYSTSIDSFVECQNYLKPIAAILSHKSHENNTILQSL